MVRKTGISGALALALVATCWAAALGAAEAAKDENAEEAAAAFEKVYGADLKAVKGARESIELAQRMLKAAKAADIQPAFLTLLCENAYALAQPYADGAKTALEAMSFLAARLPDKAGACAEKVVKVRQGQYDLSRGPARTKAGNDLIEALLAAAAARADACAYADALALTKRAQPVARAVRSALADQADARVKALGLCLKSAREAEDLKTQLEKDAGAKALREKLVRLCLMELDNPTEAARHLEGLDEGDLRKYVPAACRPLESAPSRACLELGDWYCTKLAPEASASAKGAMLERAEGYYERFVETHPAKDMDRTRVVAALADIEQQLAKLVPPALRKRRPLIDLLPWIDPARDGSGGPWARQSDAVVGNRHPNTSLVFPVMLDGSYELHLTLVRTGKVDCLMVILPVGSTSLALALNDYEAPLYYLHLVAGKPLQGPLEAFANDVEHTLKVRVLLKGDQADLAFDLDGAPLLAWSGPRSALSEDPKRRLPQKQCPGLILHGCGVVVRGLGVRVLSGDAKPLRPAGRSKAAGPAKSLSE